MFYSHEVLTSRKYGVATVWLVATLGSRSTLKRVSRKAILDVDVAKACETIVEPEAPMALRLQSSLLYGVTRVYAQQCGYVLQDAETARANMRAMLRSIRVAGLDEEGAHKAKADQLLLQDDPNFLPDFDLPPIDLDDVLQEPVVGDETQWTHLDPYSSQHTFRSQSANGSQQTIGGLMLPPSNSPFLGGPVGGLDLLSVRGDSGAGTRPAQLLEDDLGLEFDSDMLGNEGGPVRQPRAPSGRVDQTDPSSHAGGYQTGFSGQPILDYDDGPVMLLDDDLGLDLPQDGIARDGPQVLPGFEQETTSETAVASLTQRKKREPKVIALDTETTLHNKTLAKWNREYLDNMREAIRGKQGPKLAALAKKNAEYWVLGAGAIAPSAIHGSLDMFSGAGLFEIFTGINPLRGGQKRSRDEEDSSDNGRRVRSRGEQSPDELARGNQDGVFTDGFFQDDGYMPMNYDDTIEQGREAPTPLDDRHLSSIFPWNQSAGSRRPTDPHATSASMGGVGGAQLNLLGRRGSRLTSASPLVGRGTIVGGEVDDFQLPGSDAIMSGMGGEDELGIFEPTNGDTQTAKQAQWQLAALGNESANFLSFVQTAIEEEEQQGFVASIDFESLLPPHENSQIVAAQALLHVLTLGTKSLLKVEQEEPFGSINMSMLSV